MVAKLITAEEATDSQPMPWQNMSAVVAPSSYALQYSKAEESKKEENVELAQHLAAMAGALAERDRLISEARTISRREGEAAGRLAGRAEVEPVIQRLAEAIQQVSELPAQLRAQAEGDLVRLAAAIAQRILQRELNVDPEVIAGLVRVGLEKVRVQDLMRVRVSPDHAAAIKEFLTRSGGTHVEVIADPMQPQGGVIFETSRGKLDVSIGTQLQEIERGLTDRLRGQG